ncbi:MAG TPA: magnesium transporter [Anaerohalosphaeraceae bacterium]|nr:magnesium transporter [Anaerohalosphaeraceae bacterium]HOL89605.1 magnesium transporter [Anaerohalosphaeraceae bacterium]HPP55079.1 magnesium transporter [Anaerohalosphaeraceae bacterium]
MTNPLLIPELKELLANNDTETIQKFCQQNHPGTVAELISGLEPAEIWQVLHLLDPPLRAEIFSFFDLNKQVELATGPSRKDMARLLEEMPPDDRADLVRKLDESLLEEILPLVAKAEREDIRKLVSYEERTAGAVMSTDYAVLRPEMTVAQAIEQLRLQAPSKETIYYIYVIDENRKLIGFVSLKDLITAKPAQLVRDIMHTDAIFARVNDDQEVVAKLIEKYDLIAVPIVDENGVLVGIVTHDDAIDIIRQEQTEDMEKFMGIAGLAALGLVSGLVIHSFEATLMNLLILALYMPMVADTGGNTGSQAATVVVRALALGQLRPKDFLKVLLKEFQVSLGLAVILGLLSFGKVLFLSRTSEIPGGYSLAMIAAAIAVALGLQVITATLIGAALPLLVARFKHDPAVVASPALTTIVDITGLFIYFCTAKVLLGV